MENRKYGIAALIDEYTLVINAGKEERIKVGQKIKILSKHHTDILDPFTGEKLGNLHHIKDEVRVSEVHRKFSICKSERKNEISKMQMSLFGIEPRKLNFGDKFMERRITEEPINVGDMIEI